MVLQRLQSLYLLIAAILLGIFTFTTSTTISTPENEIIVGAFASGDTQSTAPNFVLCLLNALTVILAIITIFKYKNLKLQLKLCSICILLTIVTAISIAILSFQAMTDGSQIHVTLNNIYPALAIVFFYMARRGVAHDKKVIHDSESFR